MDKEEIILHTMEMKAVQLALIIFGVWIMGESLVCMSDNAMVAVYINRKILFFD